MTKEEAINTLRFFFPGSFTGQSQFIQSQDGQRILERLLKLSTFPIHVTHFNQLVTAMGTFLSYLNNFARKQ